MVTSKSSDNVTYNSLSILEDCVHLALSVVVDADVLTLIDGFFLMKSKRKEQAKTVQQITCQGW